MQRIPESHRITSPDIENSELIVWRYIVSILNVRAMRGGITREGAYRFTGRLIKLGLLYRQGGFLLPTQLAFQLAGVPFRWKGLHSINFHHWADVNSVEQYILRLTDRYVTSWRGERILRHEWGLRDEYEYLYEPIHVPDAEADILVRGEYDITTVAVEVERSQKSARRLDFILSWLAANYERTWYFANKNCYAAVKAAIGRLPASDIPKFELWSLENAIIGCDEQRPPSYQTRHFDTDN